MKIFYIDSTMFQDGLIKIICILISISLGQNVSGQSLSVPDTSIYYSQSTGWAEEAVGIGYVTAPSVLVLTLISGLVSEWNAGYFGIPATALILAAPPLIYLGGRSVDISTEILHPRAKLAWALYGLSIIPTSLAMYSYTTDWGASVPLMIASGVLGSATIVAMTSYAHARGQIARKMATDARSAWNFGIAPLSGGALAIFTYRF